MEKPGIRLKTPAKVNICLKITGKRPDGYHDLFSIMVPVDLFDSLDITINSTPRITIFNDGLDVPTDENNLIYQAVESFFSKTGIKNKGVSVKLKKNIPVAAGLGGGSSDAACTLLGLNRLFSSPMSRSDLHKTAGRLGADVPFFLDAVPSFATGIGDILEPIDNWPEFYYLIVTPPIEISTRWVYENYKMQLTSKEYNYIKKILEKDEIIISNLLDNDLEKVTSTSFPVINTLKEKLVDAGAEGAIMSGSGPSVFGVFLSRKKAVSARDFMLSDTKGQINLVKGIGHKGYKQQ